MLFCNILLYEIHLKSDNKSDIYPLMSPVLYENKIGYFMAKKDTLTIFHFGMNAAV